MSRGLPAWSYPLILALLGIVLFVGRFSGAWRGAIGGESLLFVLYLILRARLPNRDSPRVANVLSLFPGHLLLLFGIGSLSSPPSLLLLGWMGIPVFSILYDIVGSARWERRASILTGLYCIIWADLFFLLERIISLGRGLSRGEELIVSAVFGVVGVAFLGIGAYRHLRMRIDKE